MPRVPHAATLRIQQAKRRLEMVPWQETVDVQIMIEQALGAFLARCPTREDWETVASALNMALAIDTMVDKSLNRTRIDAAMGAMQEVGRNGMRVTAAHQDLLCKAVGLHHAQLGDITRGQYDVAINFANSQYRKKAYSYKVKE